MKQTEIKLVVADFYQDIAHDLITGARQAIENYNRNPKYPFIINKVDEITVPGALEIPAAIRYALIKAERDGINVGFVALGCVIRGDTSHYDIVANESARGLQILALDHLAAIGNGILTVENRAQAGVRANPGSISDHGKGAVGDKGGFAASACIDLLQLKHQNGLLT